MASQCSMSGDSTDRQKGVLFFDVSDKLGFICVVEELSGVLCFKWRVSGRRMDPPQGVQAENWKKSSICSEPK